jgi:UDP-glucose:(heptosyl)LPS alpha-1,3-glucosyltransferase
VRIGMVVVDLLDARRVGSERRYGELIKGLRQEGCALHLFARRWDVAAAAGLTCHRIPVAGPDAVQALTFALGALAVTRRWRGRLDLVHSHAKSLGEDIVSPGGSAHRALVRVLGAHDPRWRRLGRAWHPRHRSPVLVERWQFRLARRIVTNSRWSARVLAESYPFAAARTQTVYNGVDAAHFTPGLRQQHRSATRASLGVGAEQPLFLLVGAGVRRKGMMELLEAFARLPSPASRLVLVGRRDARESPLVAGALARLGLGERVILHDFTADPRPFYAAADAFVLPTIFDPFSNATAEALACGLPVITTTANGVSELMTDGREGFIVPPSDAGALGTALARMLDADRATMGQASRALAETLTWRRHVDAMLAIYGDVLKTR